MKMAPGEPVPPGCEDEYLPVSKLQKRIEPYKYGLVGLEYIIELHSENKEPNYYCYICDWKCDTSAIMVHIYGYIHRLKFMEKHFPTAMRQVNSFQYGSKELAIKPTILSALSEAIDETYGRMTPTTYENTFFETHQVFIKHIMNSKEHFSESRGHTIVEIIDRDSIEDTIKEFSKNEKNRLRKAKPASVEGSSKASFLNKEISDICESIFSKPKDSVFLKKSPVRKSSVIDLTSPIKEPSCNGDPETISAYQGWKQFVKRRCDELKSEHKDPKRHDFTPEWNHYWEIHFKNNKKKSDELKNTLDLTKVLPKSPLSSNGDDTMNIQISINNSIRSTSRDRFRSTYKHSGRDNKSRSMSRSSSPDQKSIKRHRNRYRSTVRERSRSNSSKRAISRSIRKHSKGRRRSKSRKSLSARSSSSTRRQRPRKSHSHYVSYPSSPISDESWESPLYETIELKTSDDNSSAHIDLEEYGPLPPTSLPPPTPPPPPQLSSPQPVPSLFVIEKEPETAKPMEKSPKEFVSEPAAYVMDRETVAKKISTIFQGKIDIPNQQMDELIAFVMEMQELTIKSADPLTTPPDVEMLNDNEVSITPPPPDVEMMDDREFSISPTPAENIDGPSTLTDSELETLLQNFEELSSNEQEHLVENFKALEASEPHRAEKFRKFVKVAEKHQEKNIQRKVSPILTKNQKVGYELGKNSEHAQINFYREIDGMLQSNEYRLQPTAIQQLPEMESNGKQSYYQQNQQQNPNTIQQQQYQSQMTAYPQQNYQQHYGYF